jgi:endonuclease YncB( thermonuclease family)
MSTKTVVVVAAAIVAIGGLTACQDDASSNHRFGHIVNSDTGKVAKQNDAQPSSERPVAKLTHTPMAERSQAPMSKPWRTYKVSRAVDGDTIELANGDTVRLVGIDTPEFGQCGYDKASTNMDRLVVGKHVRLTVTDEDRDMYDRLLRYVDVGSVDAGLAQIKAGLAIARYDSRDGYGFHVREPRYIAADEATPNKCATPEPTTSAPVASSGAGCEPGYSPCVPLYPPDVDCADVNGPIQVTGTDPHGLDGDGDGIGCE